MKTSKLAQNHLGSLIKTEESTSLELKPKPSSKDQTSMDSNYIRSLKNQIHLLVVSIQPGQDQR